MVGRMTEVAVIGAGIHGAAAALHLASRGAKVSIFERGTPAGGPTGRSSAICRAYYTNPFLARVARESLDLFARFTEATNGGRADFVRTGLLFLHPPEDAPGVERVAEHLNGIGTATELLDPVEIERRFPGFDLDGIGIGAYERDAGYADPAGATAGLFHRAVELGAEGRLETSVRSIEPLDGGGGTITTSAGDRTAFERILIAAGPWTGPLASGLGVDLPLTVERHVVAVFRWGAAEPVTGHADLVGGYYFRPEGRDLFLVGSVHPAPPADPDAFSETITEAESAALSEPVSRRVPRLEAAEPFGGWASLYDVSPDWQPVIGEIAPGIFVDAGTSGHGFKLAPALGRHVAGLVLGEDVDPALHDFHPRRFDEGVTLAAGYRDARILG